MAKHKSIVNTQPAIKQRKILTSKELKE